MEVLWAFRIPSPLHLLNLCPVYRRRAGPQGVCPGRETFLPIIWMCPGKQANAGFTPAPSLRHKQGWGLAWWLRIRALMPNFILCYSPYPGAHNSKYKKHIFLWCKICLILLLRVIKSHKCSQVRSHHGEAPWWSVSLEMLTKTAGGDNQDWTKPGGSWNYGLWRLKHLARHQFYSLIDKGEITRECVLFSLGSSGKYLLFRTVFVRLC